MAIDTSVQGFTGFYEPPPQEAPLSTRDFLRGFLRGAQAGAASREFKKAKEELEAINRSREEGGFEALGPQGRTAFENRTGFSPDILENRKPPGALQGILGAALGPDLQAQQGQLNQLRIAQEQRQSQLASRQFAAQDAYRNAVERDLAQAEAEAQAHGGTLDDETKVRIAAKHYLRYGATMGPGFGGALGGMISTGQRADYQAKQLDLNERKFQEQQERNDALQKLATQRLTNEEARIVLQRAGFALREIDQLLEARRQGYDIKGLPAIPGVSIQGAGAPAGQVTAPAEGVTFTPIERPPQPAIVTEQQRNVLAARNAIASIDQAIDTLQKTPEAAGIRGAVGEVVEGVGGQVGLKPGTRTTEARTQLRETAHQLVSALRVESGQMSNWERQMLEEVGSPIDWKLSADASIGKMRVLRRLIGLRELRTSKDLNKPPAALETLTDEDLIEAARARYITDAQAMAEYRRRRQ